MKLTINKLFYIFPFLILLLFFVYQVKGYYTTCLPAMDIAIFNEAISRFWYEGVLNPFINVRQIKIFNDHVDPIITIFAPIQALFGYHLVTTICIPFFAILSSLYVLRKFFHLANYDLIFIFMLMMFCRGVVGELSYPMHPILWSMPILYLFVKKTMDYKISHSFFLALFLLTFKETYAFAFFGYSIGLIAFYYHFKDKRFLKFGLPALIIATTYLCWYFLLRPKLMDGKIYNYTGIELRHLTDHGLSGFLKQWILGFNYKIFITSFLPHASLFFINRKILKKNINVLLLVAWMLPLLALHLYTNYFFNWHAVPFSIVLLGIFCCLADFNKMTTKARLSSFLVFLACSVFLHVRAFSFVFFNKSKTCEVSKTKMTYLHEMRQFIKEQKDGTAFLMTSGMIPWVMHPRFKFHQWGEYPSDRDNFDVIIFEKTNKGVHSRASNEAIELATKFCQGTEVVLNNDYVFAAKGPFSKECITMKHE